MEPDTIQGIPIDQIDFSSRLRRGEPDQQVIERLCESIRQFGVLHPVLVIKKPEPEAGYLLISGIHRLLGAKKAGKQEILARILTESNHITREVLLKAVDEDAVRKTTHAIEFALMIREMKDKGMSRGEIEDHFRFSKSHINNLERLLDLPADALAKIKRGELAPAKARSILGLRKLELSKDELAATMARFADIGCKENTNCREFNQQIQEFKAAQNGTARIYQEARCVASIERAKRWANRFQKQLDELPRGPHHAEAVRETLKPLLQKIKTLCEPCLRESSSGLAMAPGEREQKVDESHMETKKEVDVANTQAREADQ